MQTPNTPRGRETERLMAIWKQRYPQEGSRSYNREWDSVYRKLEGQFSDKEDLPKAVQFQSVVDALGLDEQQRRHLVVASSDDYVKTEPRRRRKHGPQTKGAFGKPKPYHHR